MSTQVDSSSPQRRDAGVRNASPLVGQPAPRFVLPDPVAKEQVSLESFVGRNVLLLFLRGTWCPFCVQQLQVLKDNFERLHGANVAVVAIVCQSQVTVSLFLKASPLPFPLLCDGDRSVAKSYGTHYWLSHEGFNISHPALFILDDTQTVTFAHVGRSMSDLPVARILEKFVGFLDGKG